MKQLRTETGPSSVLIRVCERGGSVSLNSASHHARSQRRPLRAPCLSQTWHSERHRGHTREQRGGRPAKPREASTPEAVFGAPSGLELSLPHLRPQDPLPPRAWRLAVTCLQGDGDVFPPVHPHHGPPAALQLLHYRAVQGLLLYPVTHILGRQTGQRVAVSVEAPRAEDGHPCLSWAARACLPPGAAPSAACRGETSRLHHRRTPGHRPTAPHPRFTHTTCHSGPRVQSVFIDEARKRFTWIDTLRLLCAHTHKAVTGGGGLFIILQSHN